MHLGLASAGRGGAARAERFWPGRGGSDRGRAGRFQPERGGSGGAAIAARRNQASSAAARPVHGKAGPVPAAQPGRCTAKPMRGRAGYRRRGRAEVGRLDAAALGPALIVVAAEQTAAKRATAPAAPS
ncbi:hypothetical protein ACH4TV_14910 [Streptomyces sp. NPDC020898]|uniref:hypothetical protein n=1 Tax=Streptomyces sp. NPDC020898 TaxID=3365101 RepID=UPI00379DB19C